MEDTLVILKFMGVTPQQLSLLSRLADSTLVVRTNGLGQKSMTKALKVVETQPSSDLFKTEFQVTLMIDYVSEDQDGNRFPTSRALVDKVFDLLGFFPRESEAVNANGSCKPRNAGVFDKPSFSKDELPVIDMEEQSTDDLPVLDNM